MLRAWADRSTDLRRVAFVSVNRNQQDAQLFWSAVLDAIPRLARSIDLESQPAAAGIDAEDLVETVLSELAEQTDPVVLIIDDVHELRSAEALAQLGGCSQLCRARRAWCCRRAGIRRSGSTS